MIYIIGVFKMNIKEMSIDDFKKEVELFLNNISEEEILDGIQKYVDNSYYNSQKIILTTESNSELLLDKNSKVDFNNKSCSGYINKKEKYDKNQYRKYSEFSVLGDVA